jgi:hypothetical protein
MRRVSLRVLFWSPIALWLAVEIYLFRLVFLNCYCGPRPTDCPDTARAMVLWGFPSSVLLGLTLYPFALPLPSSLVDSTAIQLAQLLLLGVAGVIQWYYIMRGVELLLTKLYRRFCAPDRGAAA